MEKRFEVIKQPNGAFIWDNMHNENIDYDQICQLLNGIPYDIKEGGDDLSIGIVFGGYLDQHSRLMDRKELNRRIHGLQAKNEQLEKELFQQRFNNEHNLSIDGVISDKIINQEKELIELRWRIEGLEK